MEEKKNRKKTAITLAIIIILMGIAASKVGSYLPTIGDINTPANANVSSYYIEHAIEDTHSYNLVTAVLADYRGFDTLFEICVLFLSGIAALSILSTKKKVPQVPEDEIILHHKKSLFGSAITDVAFRVVVPIILIYGVYVLFHGEVSLGGGFQAGALLACAYLLDRIILTFDRRVRKGKEELAILIAAIGTLFYLITGLLPMFNGGNFLEFSKSPLGASSAESLAELHATGITMVEIGVTVCVMGVIITILEVVLERTNFNE